ncbi:hypothetical protein HKX48_003229, partial [Thoreauomyces humboldtii]
MSTRPRAEAAPCCQHVEVQTDVDGTAELLKTERREKETLMIRIKQLETENKTLEAQVRQVAKRAVFDVQEVESARDNLEETLEMTKFEKAELEESLKDKDRILLQFEDQLLAAQQAKTERDALFEEKEAYWRSKVQAAEASFEISNQELHRLEAARNFAQETVQCLELQLKDRIADHEAERTRAMDLESGIAILQTELATMT